MKIGQYCQRHRCRHVELEQFWQAFASRGFVSDSWAFLFCRVVRRRRHFKADRRLMKVEALINFYRIETFLWNVNDDDYADTGKLTQTLERMNCREARKQVQPKYVNAVIVGGYHRIRLLFISSNTIHRSRIVVESEF